MSGSTRSARAAAGGSGAKPPAPPPVRRWAAPPGHLTDAQYRELGESARARAAAAAIVAHEDDVVVARRDDPGGEWVVALADAYFAAKRAREAAAAVSAAATTKTTTTIPAAYHPLDLFTDARKSYRATRHCARKPFRVADVPCFALLSDQTHGAIDGDQDDPAKGVSRHEEDIASARGGPKGSSGVRGESGAVSSGAGPAGAGSGDGANASAGGVAASVGVVTHSASSLKRTRVEDDDEYAAPTDTASATATPQQQLLHPSYGTLHQRKRRALAGGPGGGPTTHGAPDSTPQLRICPVADEGLDFSARGGVSVVGGTTASASSTLVRRTAIDTRGGTRGMAAVTIIDVDTTAQKHTSIETVGPATQPAASTAGGRGARGGGGRGGAPAAAGSGGSSAKLVEPTVLCPFRGDGCGSLFCRSDLKLLKAHIVDVHGASGDDVNALADKALLERAKCHMCPFSELTDTPVMTLFTHLRVAHSVGAAQARAAAERHWKEWKRLVKNK